MLRAYTGPWFAAVNFYLRYLPDALPYASDLRCCDAQPYFVAFKPHGAHSARRCFLEDPKRKGVCRQCGKPFDKHSTQPLDSWASSAAILCSGIVKLSAASRPATVYRGVKEEFIQLPEDFVARSGDFARGVEPGAMSTTFDRGVAVGYAGEGQGSLYEI